MVGYLLCPIPEVLEHCWQHKTGNHHHAMDRVLCKLFADLTEEEEQVKLDKFWEEWNDFHHPSGPIFIKTYPQNSPHLLTVESHLWYRQYTDPFTDVLG